MGFYRVPRPGLSQVQESYKWRLITWLTPSSLLTQFPSHRIPDHTRILLPRPEGSREHVLLQPHSAALDRHGALQGLPLSSQVRSIAGPGT